ncbi:hypothetical protein C0992_007313 [Termitomyces sp. T32_za158]|nr:hypothetical protein C0992_007313 [Termitomyces sp. T32_za158]
MGTKKARKASHSSKATKSVKKVTLVLPVRSSGSCQASKVIPVLDKAYLALDSLPSPADNVEEDEDEDEESMGDEGEEEKEEESEDEEEESEDEKEESEGTDCGEEESKEGEVQKEEEEEEEEAEEEAEAEATVKVKAKRAYTKRTTDPRPAANPEPVTITYNLLILPLSQMQLPKTRREPHARLLEAKSDLAWEDLRSLFDVKISNTLFPTIAKPDFSKFDIKFSIPRVVLDPMPLSSAEDYSLLLKVIQKIKAHPTVKISITETSPQPDALSTKENDAPEEDTRPKKKARKSKAPKESDILPANVALNDRIKQIRDRWECNVSMCHSEHCFVPAVGPHLPLSHEMVEKWAAAWLRDETLASLDTPPHIALFDEVSPLTLGQKSPILQARLNNMVKNSLPPQPLLPSAPVVNVVMPNDMFGFLRPAAPSVPMQPIQSTTLLPSHLVPGPKLDISTFCHSYDLSDNILKKLKNHAYTGTQAFRHIDVSELKDMGFLPGEIVDLKEAVIEWAGNAL